MQHYSVLIEHPRAPFDSSLVYPSHSLVFIILVPVIFASFSTLYLEVYNDCVFYSFDNQVYNATTMFRSDQISQSCVQISPVFFGAMLVTILSSRCVFY